MEGTEDKKNLSVKMTLIILFILLTLITIGVVSCIVFSNWLSYADETIVKMAKEMNDKIFDSVDAFIDIPLHINKINQHLIENNIVKLDDEIDRERFFVSVLKNHSNDVYSFGYGTVSGEYYGARRNENNEIEIMRNTSDTNGYLWYYSVTDDIRAGKPIMNAGKFDPRTSDWYISAKEKGKPVFSSIYKHFIMEDLTVSASLPIYNKAKEFQGVLGCHITLSAISNFLKEIVKDNNSIALIIERQSGKLIANSLDIANFKIIEKDTIKRLNIEDIDNKAIIEAYNNYQASQETIFKLEDNNNDKLYISLVNYNENGLDWLVITATPESLFMTGIIKNIKIALLLTAIALIISIAAYLKLINRILKPIDDLIDATIRFSQGDLSQKAPIRRNDEIGRISKSFNKMADTIYMLVNNLETKVKERTSELVETNKALKESKDRLQLILDSTAEAIYGIDINGYCTFCNTSCLKILGYKDPKELIGKNMHLQIHHSYRDGTPMPLEECGIYKAFMEGTATYSDDEVFWRADGTSFDVEYCSYPQYKDGKIIGAVVTFKDNTERKRNEEYIKYLSYHDSLTGLYNRMFLENELKKIDNPKNLPISIIFGDINGLKLTNDIFGHSAGDTLLKKSAEILKKVCRERDIIARIGGDEFTILLPNTKAKDAEKIIRRIKNELSKEQIDAIKCNMSIGYDTKTTQDQDIKRVRENAESSMYEDKTLNRKTTDLSMLKTIIETLHRKSPRERYHSIVVSDICQKIGRAMKLPEAEIIKLKKVGFLHDIGKIVVNENILNKTGVLTEEERKEMQQHSIVGYRILNLFNDTMDLAESVFAHHENWDGSGYPKGLKGKQIPKLARIVAVAENYEAMTNPMNKNPLSKEEAYKKIKMYSKIKFDPKIVDIFLNLEDS